MPLSFLLLIVVSTITPSFAADDYFPNCVREFSCGTLQNISYPFTGGDRPAYCGPPEFRLTCPNNNSSYPELTTNSLTYRVLQIDQTQHSLVLARLDLYNNTCPQNFINSTFNSSVFAVGSDNVELNLIYGCDSSPSNSQLPYVLSCNSSAAYYYIGIAPVNFVGCTMSLTVPVLRTFGDELMNNLVNVVEVLTAGFSVKYTDPYDRKCLNCSNSGGQCGFLFNPTRPICICGNRLCVNSADKGKSKATSLAKIFLIVGPILLGILILVGCLIILPPKKTISRATVLWKTEKSGNQNIEEFMRSYGTHTPQQYSYSDIKKMTNSFKEKLGQGGYGGVFKGKLSDGRLIAVKILNETQGDGEDFINEVASISRTSQVNVVTLLGFCFERNRRALIYEFMPNKSLDKFIYDDKSFNMSRHLSWSLLSQISVGIARGLEYLHSGCSTRIVHFDIKPQNILLDKDFCPKISDFGLAKLCKKRESIISMLGTRGTAGYIAPEVFSRNFGRVSHKSDVYSYGMMLLEMAGARNKAEVECSSESYFPDSIYENLENDADIGVNGVGVDDEEKKAARKMIVVSLWCIQTIPADRPSMSKVVEMLEASVESLQIPPKPLLHSPTRTAHDTSMSQPLNSTSSME